MLDKETIRCEIANLDLPSIVLEIFDGVVSYPALAYRCEAPDHSLVAGSGLAENLLPLWECGTCVTAYDKSDRSYCRISLESPGEVFWRVKFFDEVVADLFVDLWEDELSDDDLGDLASQFEFQRLKALMTALESGPVGDYDHWRAALRSGGPK